MNSLDQFGWTDETQKAWDTLGLSNVRPARVIADFGTSLTLATPERTSAELSGKLAHYSKPEDTPKVGDWVAVHITDSGSATVESVVLRSNEIARKVAGKRVVKQIVAANIDIAFVLLALDNDFSIERLQRFLYQLSTSNIEAVIVLNKADKTEDLASYTAQLAQLDLPIVITTAIDSSGIEDIASRVKPGKTAILLGSSGVGKSTITNKLLGRDIQQTNSVRERDDTGKHTTVHRELFILPNGGILIDTPGIRELQLWGSEDQLDENFDDITELMKLCKYSNCNHTKESGCAIRDALRNKTLDKKHYANYLKMKSELSKLAARKAERIRLTNGRKRSAAKPTYDDF